MPLDIAALAGTVVTSFLIPIAKKAMDKVKERLTQDVGDKAADEASGAFHKVWDRVKQLFTSDTDKVILEQFQEHPEEAAPLVKTVLEKKLQEDEAAAEELSELVNAPSLQISGINIGQIVADTVGIVDARGANISGRVSGVSIGNAPDPGPKPEPGPAKKEQSGG